MTHHFLYTLDETYWLWSLRTDCRYYMQQWRFSRSRHWRSVQEAAYEAEWKRLTQAGPDAESEAGEFEESSDSEVLAFTDRLDRRRLECNRRL